MKLKSEKESIQSQLTLALNKSVSVVDEEIVVQLKKTILDLTDETSQLREALSQSQRKVVLLEEDLQSPVPFERARDKKLIEMESRVTELTLQISTLESEKVKYVTTLRDICLQTSLKLHELLSAVEWDNDDDDADIHTMSIEELLQNDAKLIENCIDSVAFLAGTTSDIAQSAGVPSFTELEGGLARVRECIVYLSAAARERDVLLSDNQSLTIQLETSESLRQDTKQSIQSMEDEVVQLTDELLSLKQKLVVRDSYVLTVFKLHHHFMSYCTTVGDRGITREFTVGPAETCRRRCLSSRTSECTACRVLKNKCLLADSHC
jgi:hypothetical protein